MEKNRKTLVEHVLEGTFRAGRHGRWLERESLPEDPPTGVDAVAWDGLRAAQALYRTTHNEARRLAIARDFARLAATVRDSAGGAPCSLVYAAIGPAPRRMTRAVADAWTQEMQPFFKNPTGAARACLLVLDCWREGPFGKAFLSGDYSKPPPSIEQLIEFLADGRLQDWLEQDGISLELRDGGTVAFLVDGEAAPLAA
jgi:hypothetical protein